MMRDKVRMLYQCIPEILQTAEIANTYLQLTEEAYQYYKLSLKI